MYVPESKYFLVILNQLIHIYTILSIVMAAICSIILKNYILFYEITLPSIINLLLVASNLNYTISIASLPVLFHSLAEIFMIFESGLQKQSKMVSKKCERVFSYFSLFMIDLIILVKRFVLSGVNLVIFMVRKINNFNVIFVFKSSQ